jgi:hypothetical protein
MMIADIYKGGPVGVETLAAGLSEPRDTIEEVIEPYLIQLGLVARTARGRCLNDRAGSIWDHPAQWPGPRGHPARPVRSAGLNGRAHLSETATLGAREVPDWDRVNPTGAFAAKYRNPEASNPVNAMDAGLLICVVHRHRRGSGLLSVRC